MKHYDAVVVGAGPNGLAAAITMARAGKSVLLVEASATVGGGARSAALTLPGFTHDSCSSAYPMAAASPFMQGLELSKRGCEWVHPRAPLAHPLDDGRAILLHRSIAQTAAALGPDERSYRRLMTPLVDKWDDIATEILRPIGLPSHPVTMAYFGLRGLRSAASLARSLFRKDDARALFAGIAAHSIMPLERVGTAAFGLVLGAAGHAVGWPFARGGAQRLSDAMAAEFTSLGGELQLDRHVRTISDLPSHRALLFDVGPHALADIAGERLSPSNRRTLRRFRYGPGVFKIDWALSGAVPWRARECVAAGTVHVGGSFQEILESESAAGRGQHAERPFLIATQPSLFDGTRAPEGQHTFWAYCHVPNGSTLDMTSRIEAQIERYAPGFRDLILGRHVQSPSSLEAQNANLVGGDVGGGENSLFQVLRRPVLRANPYRTSAPEIFLCSASTPPGGGVHGMCGYHAARTALARLW